MPNPLEERLQRMSAQLKETSAELIENQIRGGIPLIFSSAGYTEGTYQIQRCEKVSISGNSNLPDGTYIELQVQLTGDEQKMQNLQKGLEMFMEPNAGIEIEGNIIVFRKKLSS